MSLALLEAMACGRAVVATDVAGAREALGEAASAVVPVESPEALAAGILARLNDPVRTAREGAANRAIVEARYSLAQMCETIAALTLELVS
jgi:glycosyltransferase involved in cell wall biosynthesis